VSPQLLELEVEWEAMRDVEQLAAALATNTTLTRLNLTHNSIGTGAGVRLALALRVSDDSTHVLNV
jgi:Ran GTPase-activating protein (RanGAP) involved in mRNA processing and transport